MNPYFKELVESVLLDHDQNPRTEPAPVLGYEVTRWQEAIMVVGSCVVPMPENEEQFTNMLLHGKYVSAEGDTAEMPSGCVADDVLRAIQSVLR